MPEASDKGSQPYSRAFRHREMAGARVAQIITACLWVGDKVCVCPLPNGKVSGVGVALSQPFRSPYGGSCMAGYHCLMPTAFLPLRHNTNLTLTAFPSITTRHNICHPFGVLLMDVCLAGVPCFALHRLPVFFHAFGII